ncbi:MAG: hypothetical protein P0Y49_14200 [Candidatus Pedobacter colombiensis]|uniref:Uncharacterized protein n=1 Tax=Candidatus Pedobacter colombiensis TaxID=3121371 RepID=A0AAJ5W6B6_9SPHI|nr:hypothetical protein [Pedobacter sp.]WEK17950.1 MAG: hypothetical protein P0Y49_14200 [Pedobacter sp.]
MDKTSLKKRLADLRDNYSAGERQLRKLEQQEMELKQTLLRISGAITVLEEMLQQQEGE